MQYEELDIPQTGPRAAQPPSWRQRAVHQDEGAGRRLMVIAGGIGAAVVLTLAAFSLTGRHDGQVPVVQADPRPMRIKPADPGGLQVANDDLFAGAGDGQDAALAAPAETPNPDALRAEMQAQPGTASPAPEPTPVAPEATAPAAAAVLPTPAPAARTPIAAAAPQPAPRTPAPVTAAAAPSIAPSAVASATGRTQVQLAALPTQEAAQAEWKRLSSRVPAMLNGRKPEFMKVERDGKVLWRLRLGGFADIADATGFCEKLRAKGAGCAIASF